MLLRLRASDVGLLTAAQRQSLCRLLIRSSAWRSGPQWNNHEIDLKLAVLAALQQIGDGDAIPYVKRLIKHCGTWPRLQPVREAAVACLPFLQECAERAKPGNELLRAAQPVTDTLLRPARNEADRPAKLLLRASVQAPDSTARDG
jgi:hypothetical protein